jgi:hypothetical protein
MVQGDVFTVPLPCPGLGGGRAAFSQAEAPAPPCCYDIVYSHFFLDCFTEEQNAGLAERIASVSGPGTWWVISDFRQAASGWRKIFTSVWIKAMYLFFRMATQLTQQQLPDYRRALREQGFQLVEERRSMAGLIVSECWQR